MKPTPELRWVERTEPTDTAVIELQHLRREMVNLMALLSPYIGQDEMQARYGVTRQTLLSMERRGDIPTRVKGRWKRSEVLQYEANSTQ